MKKLGLCLSGGGARGAYHIGAVQALDDLGIFKDVSVISGASIGAANAAILATNPIEVAKDLWFNMPKNPLGEQVSFIQQFKDKKLDILNQGLYSMQGMDDILLRHFKKDKLKNIDFYISLTQSGQENSGFTEVIKTTFNHRVRKNVEATYLHINTLDEKTAIKAIQASCSMPGVFPPVVIDGFKYYDGGVLDNTPIKPLIDENCSDIILISTAFFGTKNTTNILPEHITFHEIKNTSKEQSVLTFTKEHALSLYNKGYKDTLNYFKTHPYQYQKTSA